MLTMALILASVFCASLFYPVLAPGKNLGATGYSELSTPKVHITPLTPPSATPALVASPAPEKQPSVVLPTQGQNIPPSEDTHLLYYALAGDSLPMVSAHFGVDTVEITSPEPIERKGLLPPGQLLIIPNRLTTTSARTKLLPDSEVTFSPSCIDFDIHGFVDEAGGYLSTYTEWLQSTEVTSGADIIARVALEYSVNPRLLLAFLEFKSGWVYGQPEDLTSSIYPMGYVNTMKKGLYLQSAWFASMVMDGYYGWREGRRLEIYFQDGQVLRLAPYLNAASVGLMNAFSYLYDYDAWSLLLYGEDSFFIFFEEMFDNPWMRAQEVEPLIPVDTIQPSMILPFEREKKWALTGGPHPAWSAADVWAALDFAPPSSVGGCHESSEWVVASMAGLVVRSGNGVVVIDQDGDGYEQTGWTLLYLHVATKDRIPVGSWVEVGDRIGHPSCEGGRSTGTHIHIARRYNGEWVPADGPLPFTLNGWQAKAGTSAYEGWLIRGNEYIYANTASTFETHMMRDD